MGHRTRILIVTPALAAANNGNWRTAARWRSFLAPVANVRCAADYDGGPYDLLIALHARRSAASIAAWHENDSSRPCVVVLTGTDLYRDIDSDPDAQRSLSLADRLVTLQSLGARRLPSELRARCRVIEQSAPPLPPLPARTRTFDMALVGHIRSEKDPLTAIRALGRLHERRNLRIRHVGRTVDPELGPIVEASAHADPRLELMGALTHGRARRVIRMSRLLLLPSRMEGGANVLIEAVQSDVPVLASAIDGSIGLLGDDYPGLFPLGDADALAALVSQAQDDPDFLATLREHGRRRAHLFAPQREAQAVRALVRELLERPGAQSRHGLSPTV